MWLSTVSESFLVDQVSLATVALILIFLRPSNVEGCLFDSYSLRLHISVDVQGLRAIFCLKTHMHGHVICAALVVLVAKREVKILHVQI